MINIHSGLLKELNGHGEALVVFCYILNRIDRKKTCFPSRALLQKETGFGRERIAKAIKILVEKNIISCRQEKKNGYFDKTIYTIETDKAGIYICAKNEELTENNSVDYRTTENRNTENCNTENRTEVINQEEVIVQLKEEAPAQNFNSELENTSLKTKTNPKAKLSHGGSFGKKDLNIQNSLKFYKQEIEASKNQTFAREYQMFVALLEGKNDLKIRLDEVLQLELQVDYEQFCKLLQKSKEKSKKFSFLLIQMINNPKYYEKKKSLYLCLNTWLNNEFK